ncbi:hypothetical protein ABCY68_004661 [Salmonella enterica]
MKTIMITQRREDFSKCYKPVPYAFRDWLYRLNRKDKLPRGKFFKGKVGGKPIYLIDEFSCLFNLQSPNVLSMFRNNVSFVIDRPPMSQDDIVHFMQENTPSKGDSLLLPTQEQIELWRKATGNEGGIAEYQQWILATTNHTKK